MFRLTHMFYTAILQKKHCKVSKTLMHDYCREWIDFSPENSRFIYAKWSRRWPIFLQSVREEITIGRDRTQNIFLFVPGLRNFQYDWLITFGNTAGVPDAKKCIVFCSFRTPFAKNTSWNHRRLICFVHSILELCQDSLINQQIFVYVQNCNFSELEAFFSLFCRKLFLSYKYYMGSARLNGFNLLIYLRLIMTLRVREYLVSTHLHNREGC